MSGFTPTAICQQSLDAVGIEHELGDIEDGKRESRVLLRAYGRCLRQLLRGAHWDFARRTAPLVLLADGSGQSPNVGNIVAVPWLYCYAYPTDCTKARFIPWNISSLTPPIPPGNIQVPPQPPLTNLGQPPLTGQRIMPARFTIATDSNYLPPAGTPEAAGVSAQARTVILTNVQNAQLVYTGLILQPTLWDELFRAALVSYIASEVIMILHRDKKLAASLRPQQIEIAKGKISQARLTDGNEGWFSSDIQVDWMRFRNAGRGGPWAGSGWGAPGPGCYGYGWDQVMFSDSSAY